MNFGLKTLGAFLLIATITGCFGGDPFEGYLGKWEKQGTKNPVVLEITRDGEMLLLNDNILRQKDFFGREKQPIVLKKSNEQLVLEAGFANATLGLSEDGSILRIADEAYSKISDSQYNQLFAQLEAERIEKEKNKKLCDELSAEYKKERQELVKSLANDWQKRNAEIKELEKEYGEKQKEIADCNSLLFFSFSSK